LFAPLVPGYADGMRCGSRVIRTGDTRSAVAAICGEPSDVQTKSIFRRPRVLVGDRVFLGDGVVEVPIEVWTYNFGPSKLLRRIRFVDGLVDEIETGGYGYREP
jgi:hypothetical protein